MSRSRPVDPVLAAPGTVWVTATRRLARHLGDAFDRRAVAAGARAWEPPRVLPWAAWIEQTSLDRALAAANAGTRAGSAVPLSAPVERAVWDRIVAAAAGARLLDVGLTADEARRAWRIAHRWRIWPLGAGEHHTEEVEVWKGWAERFERECRRLDAIDSARLADRLAATLAEGRTLAGERLVFAGFDLLDPQAEHLLTCAAQAGAQVVRAPFPRREGRAYRVEFDSPEEEIERAARWARERLERDPAARLAIVAPDVASVRDPLTRALTDALRPDDWLDPSRDHARHPPPFDLSDPPPLSDRPVVAAALDLIGLAEPTLDWPLVSRLLRSPFVAGATRERSGRARLEIELGRAGTTPFPLAGLRALAARHRDPAPELVRRLADPDAIAGEAECASRRLPSEWARRFGERLAVWGWPGDTDALDGDTWQAVAQWRERLAGFPALDAALGPLGRDEALGLVRRVAAGAFEPRRPEPAVQVLGILEAGGLEFDGLWLLGFDATRWPRPPDPTPFLPFARQRAVRSERADWEREYDVALGQTERLLAAADEVIASSARRVDDEDRRPSPLLSALPPPPAELVPRTGSSAWRRRVWPPAEVEVVADGAGPRWEIPAEVERGVAILADQAACPFRAFARHRLGARPLEPVEPGLDARTRGELVHRALAALHHALPSRDAVSHALASDGAERAAREAAEGAVRALRARRGPAVVDDDLLALEERFLERLLIEWLHAEANRESDFEVVSREETMRARIGPFAFAVRPDRIDRVRCAPGGDEVRVYRLVIDYKTGSRIPSNRSFYDARLDAPQLPAYALACGETEPVDGVAHAQVRAGEIGRRGLGRERLEAGIERAASIDSGADASPADWDALLAHWADALARTAEAFAAGDAAVDPKQDDTCRTCGLQPLCRICERARAT